MTRRRRSPRLRTATASALAALALTATLVAACESSGAPRGDGALSAQKPSTSSTSTGSTPAGSSGSEGTPTGATASPRPTTPGHPASPVHAPSHTTAKPAPPMNPRPHAALSGVGAADRAAWASWRGQQVQVNEVWNDAKDPEAGNKVTWNSMDALWSTHDGFANGKWKGALSIGQPMFASGETVRSCATTGEISTWAKALRSVWPTGTAFIRLGWEFNGDWYAWKVKQGDQAAFRSCWIKWYKLVKQASPRFQLVWNPNNQSSDPNLDVRTFWPGKAYVDAAGPDAYALSDSGKLWDPHKTGKNGVPLGIAAWSAWVAAQGVPLAVPEWAIRDQTWGSTDPAYITQMRTAFTAAAHSATGLAYESYFDGGTDYDCQFSIHDPACSGKHTAAADRYKRLWSKPYLSTSPKV